MLNAKISGDRPSEVIFCCDICGQPIEDLGLAAVVFQGEPHQNAIRPAMVAHKGTCHDLAEKLITGHPKLLKDAFCAWRELDDVIGSFKIPERYTVREEPEVE